MKRSIALALGLSLVVVGSPAHAGFLRLIQNLSLEDAADAPGSLALRGSIRNEGDETAHGVQIESVESGEILLDLGALGAGESRPVEVVVEAASLGIQEPGSYQALFRLLYRDANGVPFSAGFLSPYQRTSEGRRFAVSPPVSLVVDPGRGQASALEVDRSREFDVEVRNLAEKPVETRIRFLASKELRMRIPEGGRLELEPSASKTLRAEVVNERGLVNSTYATFVVAEGLHEGRHFVEYTSFPIAITSGSASRSRQAPGVLLVLALVFVVGGVLFWVFSRRQT